MNHNFKLLLAVLCGVLAVTGELCAQKRGQALIDSLKTELPRSKEDTGKVLLLLDISFYSANINPDTGLRYGTQALQLAEKLQFGRGIAEANRYIGINYNGRSLFPRALEHYLQAMKKYEELHDENGVAKTQVSMGLVYMSKSDSANAIFYLQQALAKLKNQGKKNMVAKVLNNIGSVYLDALDLPKALTWYNEALRQNEALGDISATESTTSNLGGVYYEMKRPDDALTYYFRALKLNEQTGNLSNRATHSCCIGNTYLYIARDTGNTALLESLFEGDRTKALLEAKKYMESGLAIFEQLGNLNSSYKYYRYLSEVQQLLGDEINALANYKKFADARDSVYNESNTKNMVTMQLQFEYDKKDAIAQAELNRQKLVRNGFVIGFAIMLLFAFVFLAQRNRIRKGKKESDELLLNILPEEVAGELKKSGTSEARHYDEVSIMFTDFKGFTALAEQLNPKELVSEIDYCFRKFDAIITAHGIEKIKTIGDAYMAVAGLPVPDNDHAVNLVRAALEIRDFMEEYKHERLQQGKIYFEIRIGIHSGEVVAGIVGAKKFAYDVWGDTVNMAARMESSGETGKVNISESTFNLVNSHFTCTSRGEIDAKGKGKVNMYFVEA